MYFQMEKNDFCIYELETHLTKDVTDSHTNGELTVIWRNWDNIINTPEMVYVNSINPREIKGPHIHKNRTSYFYCLEGKIIIVIRDKNKIYHNVELNEKNQKLLSISNGIPAAILNPTSKISKLLVLADVAWKPNDDEMKNVLFDDYDLGKLVNTTN